VFTNVFVLGCAIVAVYCIRHIKWEFSELLYIAFTVGLLVALLADEGTDLTFGL